MKKRIILMLTMLALFVCVFAIYVSAAECIDGIYYTFSGTEATVSGDNQKKCELETVVIPQKVIAADGTEYTVTAIATKAFGSQNADGGNSKIKSVTIPATVTSVGERAFAECPNLTEAYCKSTKIGSRMFQDSANLKTVTFENTVEIGGNAFNRTAITSLVIPSTVTTVGDYAFKECASITKVVILGPIMGNNMFYGCSALNTLVLTENFVTFGTSCLGNANQKAFTTYYTGTDYDRIKTLGSSTSRFKEAKCSSYSDYLENGHTKTYMLVYDTNLCIAAFDGNHTEPFDDGDCTTALICSVCVDYTYKEAKEHANNKKVTYASFLQEGEYNISCTNDGCTSGSSQKLEALFSCLGFSTPTDGRDGVVIGFSVNGEAIAKYKEITGNTFKYGAFAAAEKNIGTNDIVDANGISPEKVVCADLTEYNLASFDLVILGFGEDQKDLGLAMGAYVIDGDTVSYLQAGTPSDGAKYYFASYNTVMDLIAASKGV